MKITDSKQLGTLIREHRKRLKITQKDLAFASGTGTRFISDLEKGKQTCEIGKVLIILNSLGLKFSVLMQDEEYQD
tara:strand:- start:2902 stop:3129 length:228 start_codon:yes stop_codon:yes gene_type:complete